MGAESSSLDDIANAVCVIHGSNSSSDLWKTYIFKEYSRKTRDDEAMIYDSSLPLIHHSQWRSRTVFGFVFGTFHYML